MVKTEEIYSRKEMELCEHEYIAGHLGTQLTYPPKYIAMCICTKCGLGAVFSDMETEEVHQIKLDREKYFDTLEKFEK